MDPDVHPTIYQNQGAMTVLESLEIDDIDLCAAASVAQTSQDGGHTWGEALTAFKAALR